LIAWAAGRQSHAEQRRSGTHLACPWPPLIRLTIGSPAEAPFRRALSISQGDSTVLFTDPLWLALLIIAALALLGPFLWRWRGRRRQIAPRDCTQASRPPRHPGSTTAPLLTISSLSRFSGTTPTAASSPRLHQGKSVRASGRSVVHAGMRWRDIGLRHIRFIDTRAG
jgi:hypothetical protein